MDNSVSSTFDSLEEHLCEMESVELNEDSDSDMNLEQLGQALLEASSEKQKNSEKSKQGRRKVKKKSMLAGTIMPGASIFHLPPKLKCALFLLLSFSLIIIMLKPSLLY